MTLSLDQAEENIQSVFKECFPPSDVGEKSVEGQKNFISGFIYCLFTQGKISQIVHNVLHSIYFEGMPREMAIDFHSYQPEPVSA